jgi:chromosome partitioning protein
MLVGYKRASSLKILIINRKGGAGKSTFAIALASLYDHQNIKTELIDLDPQGTCYFWGNKHPSIKTQKYLPSSNIPFSLALRLEASTKITIIDSPSNFSQFEMDKYLSMVDKIIFPVQPSPIDVHAMLGFVKDLLKSPIFLHKKIELAFVVTRSNQSKSGLELVTKVLHHMKYPLLGVMSEDECYQQMFVEKKSFLTLKTNIDNSLWSQVKRWIKIDTSEVSATYNEPKKKSHIQPTPRKSILNKYY